MSKIFPFEGKGGVKKNPIQKMGFDYAMQGEYRISTTEDEFFTAAMFRSARSGVKHRTGTSTNIKVLKHFTLVSKYFVSRDMELQVPSKNI